MLRALRALFDFQELPRDSRKFRVEAALGALLHSLCERADPATKVFP